MKHLVKIFVVTFFLTFSTYSLAEQKIVYFDLKYTLNNSSAGKGAQDQLKKMFSENQKKFEKQEKELKKFETDLIAKKSVLLKEEYQKKADSLRNKVTDYQKARRESLDNITLKRANAKEQLLNKINPILEKYSNDNNISVILNSKSVLFGSEDSDITKLIVGQLNKELPSIILK